MKPIFTLFLIFLFLSPSFIQAQKSSKLVGAWKKIYTKITPPDGEIQDWHYKVPAEQQIRIYNRTHYAFGIQNTDGSLGSAGGGRYEILEKGVAKHWRDYHIGGKSFVGTSTAFEYAIRKDTLSVKGKLPNDSVWEEKFLRVR